MKHIVFATAALLLAGFTFHGAAQTSVVKTDWGKTADGHPVEIFALSDSDLKIRITTFGARVVSIDAPDRRTRRKRRSSRRYQGTECHG